MADYSLLGSFSDGGASALSGDLLTKLREADEKSIVAPIDTKLETWDTELAKIDEIKAKVTEFADVMQYFDISNDENVFTQKYLDPTGSSAMFNADNVANLEDGTTTISISQLAQRDVYQTNSFTDKTAVPVGTDANDNITISIGSGDDIVINTDGKTYQEIADAINLEEGLSASVEQVGDDSYRLVIKSTETGLSNALTIAENGIDLGITDSDGDGTADDTNHILSSQNLLATIDGIEYNKSSNIIDLSNGLNITAVKVDEAGETSSLTVSKDSSAVLIAIEQMTEQYNGLLDMINEELNSAESSISDKSALRNIQSDVKNMLFGSYGAPSPIEWGDEVDEYGDSVLAHSNVLNNDKNIFNYGFELDEQGYLSLDSDKFTEDLDDNMEDLRLLFVGSFENKGLGTQLNEYLISIDSYAGSLYTYSIDMITDKEDLEKEKEDAIAALDNKYTTMGESFAQYGAMISQMEAGFSGLKQMMADANSE